MKPLQRAVHTRNVSEGPRNAHDGEIATWVNDVYVVIERALSAGNMVLSIGRIDGEAVHNWRDFQAIKNQLAGPEREAIELYPAESRLVDTVNEYHLWVMPEGKSVPCGFTVRAAPHG